MAEDFNTLIDRNKRNCWILMVVFVLLIVAVAGAIGMAWGGGDWRFSLIVGGIAAGVSFLICTWSFFAGAGAILAINRAREIQKQDDP